MLYRIYIYIYIYLYHIVFIIKYILYYISTPTSRTSKIEARRLQNRGPEVPKSRSGGSKIEVLGRHGGFLGRLGRLGASREAPGGPQAASWGGLGAVLGPSWGGLEGQEAVFGASLGRLGAILEPSEAILRRLGASNGCNM